MANAPLITAIMDWHGNYFMNMCALVQSEQIRVDVNVAITQLVFDMIINIMSKTKQLFSNSAELSLLFWIFLQVDSESTRRNAALAANIDRVIMADDERRPISIGALAECTGFSKETTRRHVMALVKLGACRRVVGRGFIVTREFEISPEVERIHDAVFKNVLAIVHCLNIYQINMHSDARSFVRQEAVDLKTFNNAQKRMISRATISFVLKIILYTMPIYSNFTKARLFVGVMQANSRVFVNNYSAIPHPEASEEFAPDHMKQAVSINLLATKLNIPYATAYRHVQDMISENWLAQTNNGLIIPNAILRNAPFDNIRNMIYAWFIALIRNIRLSGCDIVGLAGHYAFYNE